jgi:hypothetical protein
VEEFNFKISYPVGPRRNLISRRVIQSNPEELNFKKSYPVKSGGIQIQEELASRVRRNSSSRIVSQSSPEEFKFKKI